MIDVAYEIVKEKTANGLSFAELWALVKAELEISDEEAADKIGQLYTDLTLDGRFVSIKDSVWDLRERHTRKEIAEVQQLNGAYTSDSITDSDPEENDEEEEGEEKSEEDEESTEEGKGEDVSAILGLKNENNGY